MQWAAQIRPSSLKKQNQWTCNSINFAAGTHKANFDIADPLRQRPWQLQHQEPPTHLPHCQAVNRPNRRQRCNAVPSNCRGCAGSLNFYLSQSSMQGCVDPKVIHLRLNLSRVYFCTHFLATLGQNPQLSTETTKRILGSNQNITHNKL